MPRASMQENLGDWIGKLDHTAARAPREMGDAVEASAKDGRDAAKTFARRTAGAHGKHFHKSMTAEQLAPRVWEYGPDSAMPQGGMNFEEGPGPQTRPHRSLARSADIVGPALARDVQRLAAKWLS